MISLLNGEEKGGERWKNSHGRYLTYLLVPEREVAVGHGRRKGCKVGRGREEGRRNGDGQQEQSK